MAEEIVDKFVAQKTAQRDDFVLQFPVDSDLGITSSQSPCVDNFEIFPTVGHTLPDSPRKASEIVLQADCDSVQDEHVDSVDEDEVLDDVSQELAIVPLGHVHEVPVAEICVVIDPILIEYQVRSTIAHEGVVFGVPIPRILLAPIPPVPPSSSLKVAAPSSLIITESIRGRIEDKRGRMMRVEVAFFFRLRMTSFSSI